MSRPDPDGEPREIDSKMTPSAKMMFSMVDSAFPRIEADDLREVGMVWSSVHGTIPTEPWLRVMIV